MRRGLAVVLKLAAGAAGCYYAMALVAALRSRRRPVPAAECPPVSILKPVYGLDPHFEQALRSHLAQDYPEYEILIGAHDPADPALAAARRVADGKVRTIVTEGTAPNGKAAVLAELAAHARHPVLVVNDSDIHVEPDYLRRVTAPLADPAVGLVTCLYRAQGDSFPARFAALGIATEFAPSVLAARLLGVSAFALGSTMAFRARDLGRVGGFAAIASYLADDYQLGRRIASLGLRVALADTVVETSLPDRTWGDAWRRQVRWARTIRVSRPGGYYGYAVTHATVWSLAAGIAGAWSLAAAVMAVRLAAGVSCGAGVLGDRNVPRLISLMPLRDLWGFAVWIAGLSGQEVEWRGQRLRLDSQGRILTK
jgi:ceramide glucosyltransferase